MKMYHSRLNKFNACPGCLYWQIKRFLRQRKESWERFKKEEIKNINLE